MAESKSSGNKSGSKRGGSGGGRRRRSARETVDDAKLELEQLLGRPVEGVLGMERDGTEWTVMFQVLELQRVPNSTDLLGKYEVTVDDGGEITGVKRTRRYYRSEAGED